MRDKILYGVISFLMAAGILVAVPAFAQSTQTAPARAGNGDGQSWGGRGGMQQRAPGVFGTVSAVNGTTLTVTSKAMVGPNTSSNTSSSSTTYTINAASATVMKDNATSSVSSILAGDTVMVQGTVSGDTVTATMIRDGVVPQGMGMGKGGGAIASLQGNGEPVVGGSITAINGDSLTVTNKANVTYAVDATNATVIVKNATSSISDLTTGDNVIVQGTVNGTAVTASSVIDQGAQTSGSGAGAGTMHGIGGFMGAIGGFIQHLFGFF